MVTLEPKVDRDTLPALYRAADDVSLASQRRLLQLVRADLVALGVGACASAFATTDTTTAQVIAAVAALSLVLSLLLTVALHVKNPQRGWYGGRAAAESVKTLAWRYMTCAEPFTVDLTSDEADRLLASSFREILNESATLEVTLAGSTAEQVTPTMRAVRALSTRDRLTKYVHDRIKDQREWYTAKAAASDKAEGTFFRAVIALQFVALVAAVTAVATPNPRVNISGVASTAAASVFAWLQVRRHQELAQSYAVAAQELGLIEAQALHISTEAALSEFVADAETAVSREHTLWIARRDATLGARRR